MALVDDQWATVGSSNLDPLSLSFNLEANLFIRDPAFNQTLYEHLHSLAQEHCKPVTLERMVRGYWWRAPLIFACFHIVRHFPRIAGWFPAHRQRLMELVGDGGAEQRLLVLGVGNASDLDLPLLTERFGEVHLVDVDGAALQRAKSRQPAAVQACLVLHADVDLSGLLEHLDDWGDAFPEPQLLGATAVAAARRLVADLGRFDVVLSTCLLSQLGLPFRRNWVAPASTWANLSAALNAPIAETSFGVFRM